MRNLVLVGIAILCCRSAAADEAPPRDDRNALLVGVTTYENLPKGKHLVGPGNDVVLMRKLLVERFGFRPERITVLSEAEGAARGPEFLPTRANIAAGFARLARLPKAGDQAVILTRCRTRRPSSPRTRTPRNRSSTAWTRSSCRATSAAGTRRRSR